MVRRGRGRPSGRALAERRSSAARPRVPAKRRLAARRPRRAGAVVCVVALIAAIAAGPAAAQPAPGALSSAEKRAQMVDVIERFVPHAETFWRPSDLREPRTGRYDAVGPGVTQPRGAGNIAIAYATLLTARPEQERFGGVPRAELLEHTIQSIRHEALTSTQSGAGYDRWGGGTWQASLETYGWGFAAKLLWPHLDEETRALVRRVITAEADILITKPIESREFGDTGAEDSGWNTPTPALATVMFPDHPNRVRWEETAQRLALNASSTRLDEASDLLVDGRPLRDWIVSANIHPDLTMENHGFFNPIYQQVTHANIGEGAAIYAQSGHPVPEAFSFRTEEIWDRVLGPLTTDDGDFVATAGQDWTSKDYQHLLYLSTLTTRFGRADASVAEARALTLVARRQATHADGSILGQPQLGYESHLIKRMTAAWWNHKLFGPEPAPTGAEYERARERTAGVHRYPDVGIVQARQRDAFVSMSWDDARPMGLVVPAATGHLDDPILSYYAPFSLVGTARGAVGPTACDCREDRFSTAGTIGTRRFAMSAFPDGVTMVLDRGEGATFSFALERIEGFHGPRPIHSAGGTGEGELPGNWVNAADRLGMAVAGGGGGGIRTRRVETPNSHTVVEGSATTGTGNRGAILLPLADRDTTARMAEHVRQPDVPDGWSALLARAPDGTARFTFARWAGPDAATLELSESRGAPVTSVDARITGRAARADVRAEAPSARGEIVRFFADARDPVAARLLDEHRALLRNPGSAPARVAVRYVTPGGDELTAERVLEAGEEATARVLDGRLTLAGPEYEPLLAARDRMAALASQIAEWRADGTLRPGQGAALAAIVELVRREIGEAVAAAGEVRPDTENAAAAVERARLFLAVLGGAGSLAHAGPLAPSGLGARLGHLPPEVAARVAADRAATDALLDRAIRDGLSVRLRLEALDAARPTERLRLRATLLHRGRGIATQGSLRLQLLAGWSAEPAPDVGSLQAGGTRVVDLGVRVAGDARGEVSLRGAFSYRARGDDHTSTGQLAVTVEPLLELEPLEPRLPLAAGGWNRADVRVISHAGRELDVDVSAAPPAGVSVEPASRTVRIAPGQAADAAFELRNAATSTGAADLALTASTARATAVNAAVRLEHSDNLALNPFGTRWPAAFADDAQPAFPPSLANDGRPDTFWVSAGTAAGQGPSLERPIALGVDVGAPARIAQVTMTPRVGFGPRAYRIEVGDDGQTWRAVADVEDAPNGPVTTRFEEPTTARRIRLVITDSWDRVRPPRNVQVAELAASSIGL